MQSVPETIRVSSTTEASHPALNILPRLTKIHALLTSACSRTWPSARPLMRGVMWFETMRKEREKRIFTAWGREDEEYPHMLVGGEEPLKFNDGSTDPDCQKKFFTISACTSEEAMAIYHLRQGWEPYRPEGKATYCPECGALHYPNGSGMCWSCSHQC